MAFQKGKSGNPHGRPPSSKIFSDEIMRLCHEQNLHKAIIAKMARMALDGDVTCMKMIIERLEGKATQRFEVSTQSRTLQEIIEELADNGDSTAATDDSA